MREIVAEQFGVDSHFDAWNSFIKNDAVNSSFIHSRKYLDYHGDRFSDNSLVFTSRNKIIAVLPAVKQGDALASHPGLTFGGFIVGKKCRFDDTATIIELTKSVARQSKFKKIILTLPPYIYNQRPTDDIEYNLLRAGAKLSRQRLLSVVDLSCDNNFSQLRRRGIKKAHNNDLKVESSTNLAIFYMMLTDNLAKRYDAVPVHSLSDLEFLSSLFPDNIKIYMVYDRLTAVAASMVYITSTVYKTQYITSTDDGRSKGAVDLLIATIIEDARKNKRRFVDLGSSERSPGNINNRLLFQKEGFGARGVCLNTFTLDIE